MSGKIELIDTKTTGNLTGYSEKSVQLKVYKTRKGEDDFILPLAGRKGEKWRFLKSAVENWVLERHAKSNPHNPNVGTEQISQETMARLAKHKLAPHQN